jgi:hypothetical protein
MMPKKSAMAPEIPSRSRVKDVSANELLKTSSRVRTRESGRFLLTAWTASEISRTSELLPVRLVRIAKTIERRALGGVLGLADVSSPARK